MSKFTRVYNDFDSKVHRRTAPVGQAGRMMYDRDLIARNIGKRAMVIKRLKLTLAIHLLRI